MQIRTKISPKYAKNMHENPKICTKYANKKWKNQRFSEVGTYRK